MLALVRALAAEVGGDRARRAVSPEASLEREVGLGSLERVELLLRLEAEFGCALGDGALTLDTPAALAEAVGRAEGAPREAGRPAVAPALGAARALAPVKTIPEALWRRAQSEGQRPHVYMREHEGPTHTVTYERLRAASAAVAGGLHEQGIRAGDTVAIMLPTGFDFLRTFMGVLGAGAVPVPIYPPVRLDRLEEYAARQSAILANAEVRALITLDRARPIAALLRTAVPSLRLVASAEDLAGMGAAAGPPQTAGADPAFIQYTSGSTGQPKGVLLTHDNLLANIRAIAAGVEARPTDVGASWLPLYHDMGLIGSWLFCLVQGIPIDIQSPLAFLARPERWLWAIHERRATLSPAPNFAFELCARRIPDAALEGLDLSSWRCALNGAEPVSPETLERFVKRFEPYGFRREAMFPVYGLAESSVALCFPPVGRAPRFAHVQREAFEREGRAEPAAGEDASALRFVSVGRALPEHEVRLLDDRGQELGEGVVGRLVFRGPSTTPGYYRQPEATAAITLPGGFLDSGDLAFSAEGEIHIAGRRKDLIIKAGRNLIPQEIEEIVAGVDGIRRGCVVAFGITPAGLGTESLVVVAETRTLDGTERDALAAAVTERVSAALGVPPDAVALVGPGAVPKTSSGKVRRAETREQYLRGELGHAARTPWHRRARLLAAAALAEAGTRLRHAPRLLFTAYAALVLALLFLVLWPIAMALPRRAARVLGRCGARLLLLLCGCRVSAEGRQRLPRGPGVLVSNHASYADVPILMARLPADVLFVAKKEVRDWPLVGPFMHKVGHLTVDRFDVQQSLADADAVTEALRAGRSVVFFPEGTFTHAAGLRPFRLGAFKAAAAAGVPVVPLALRGTRRVLGESLRARPARVQLWLGEPLLPEGEGWRAVVELRDRAAEAIAAHCGEPRLDLVAAGPVR
ncbi:MAG TPA: AMP-binding protein [Vicinamibacteria bacterium]